MRVDARVPCVPPRIFPASPRIFPSFPTFSAPWIDTDTWDVLRGPQTPAGRSWRDDIDPV